MTYDEGLAERIRETLGEPPGLTERKMFGGIAFMLNGNMACGIIRDELMARVGPDAFDQALSRPHVREMDFAGRPMKGMVFVEPAGVEDDAALGVDRRLRGVRRLVAAEVAGVYLDGVHGRSARATRVKRAHPRYRRCPARERNQPAKCRQVYRPRRAGGSVLRSRPSPAHPAVGMSRPASRPRPVRRNRCAARARATAPKADRRSSVRSRSRRRGSPPALDLLDQRVDEFRSVESRSS